MIRETWVLATVRMKASVSSHPDAVPKVDMAAVSKPANTANKVVSRAVVSSAAKRDRKTWKTTTNSPLAVVRDRPVDRIVAVRVAVRIANLKLHTTLFFSALSTAV